MSNKKWVSIYGNAPSFSEMHVAEYAKDITLRYMITPSIGGERLRLHFHNLLGQDDVKLAKVSVSLADKGSQSKPGTSVPVLFTHQRAVSIQRGTSVCSDEIPLPFQPGELLFVSVYLADYTDMTCGVLTSGPLTKNFCAKGDFCDEAVFPADLTIGCPETFFLYQIDVLADEGAHAIVAFGDSITAQSWPEWLTLRLINDGHKHTSVVRRGIGGSRILREYKCLQTRHYGQSGISRFERDIDVPGADSVIVLHGVNDIIHPDGINPFRPMSHLPTAEDMIAGFRTYIDIAHRHGQKIYLATILPFEGWRTYNAERNAIRIKVNEWIRQCGKADGVIDFDAAVRDPKNPTSLLGEFASGDHLHPSIAGAKKLAATVPEGIL